MVKYTLGFIKRGNEILMLNRQKSPWMGSWNGVGGKIQEDESALTGMIREIKEETGIDVIGSQIQSKGILTWDYFNAIGNGLHIFLIELHSDFVFESPLQTREGILDWKKIDWIIDFNNSGVADNIPYFLPSVLNEREIYHYHCSFKDKVLVSVTKTRIEEEIL